MYLKPATRLSLTLLCAAWIGGLAGLARAGACDSDPTVSPLVRAVAADPQNVVNLYNLGVACYKRGCYDDALSAFQRAVDTNRGDAAAHRQVDADAYQLLGIIDYQVKKDDNGAVAWFKKALALAPDDSLTLRGLGMSLTRLGKFDQAAAYLEKAVKARPRDLEPQYRLAIALDSQYQESKDASLLPRVIAALSRTAALAGADRQANKDALLYCYTRLGILYHGQGEHAKAIGALRQVTRINPDDYNANYLLGLEYYAEKDYDNMVDAYQKATQAEPGQKDAHFNLGVAYINEQRFDEAAQQFKDITQLDPSNAEALELLAQANTQAIDQHLKNATDDLTQEKYRDALAELDKVTAIDPRNAQARKYAADAREKLEQNFDQAMQLARKAQEKHDRYQEMIQLGQALSLKPDDPTAKAMMDKVGGEISDRIRFYMLQGHRAEASGDYAHAIQQFKRALALKRNSAPVKRALAAAQRAYNHGLMGAIALGRRYLREGKVLLAKAQFENAQRVDKNNAAALDGLTRANTQIRDEVKRYTDEGEQAMGEGRRPAAKALFEKALALDANNSRANSDYRKVAGGTESAAKANADQVKKLYYQGVDYYVNGQLDKAIQSWNEVLKIDPSYQDALQNKQRAETKLAALKKLGGA